MANPTALLLSAVLMLRHIDEGAAADRIMRAVSTVLIDGKVRTRDLLFGEITRASAGLDPGGCIKRAADGLGHSHGIANRNGWRRGCWGQSDRRGDGRGWRGR